MIRHLVWWDLKPEADGHNAVDNAKRLKEQGEAMMGQIPGLVSIEISYSILPSSSIPVSVILHTTHPDADALAVYAGHPVHVAFGGLVKTVTENRRCIDYEF